MQRENRSRYHRGPRIIAVAWNLGDLWGEQHGIETRTKPNHSWVNSGRLTIGGNYSRSPIVNLTNHSYFNFKGAGEGNVLEHELKLNADRFASVDANGELEK